MRPPSYCESPGGKIRHVLSCNKNSLRYIPFDTDKCFERSEVKGHIWLGDKGKPNGRGGNLIALKEK